MMKTQKFIVLAVFAILTLSSFAQESQKRFGFELSSGASFATQKLDDAKLNTGYGFEGIFHYRFMPHLGAYAGWGWNKMPSETSFAGNDICFEETGYVYGLEFKHPIKATPLSYYVRGGGLYNHIETENADGDIIHDTGHGFGMQLAAGVDLDLGSNWSITPGIKFNSLNRESDFEGTSKDLTYQYISARVGIMKRF